MVKKLMVTLLVIILILPAFSCSASNAREIQLVPGTANMVLQIQAEKILTNSVLNIAYGELAKAEPTWPQTVGDALNQMAQKTGFDLSSISSAVFFADIESANQTQNTYVGLIASGTFNEAALIAEVQQQIKQTLTTSNYGGFTVYAGEKDEFEIAFLSQSQLVLGAPKAVRDVVDVKNKNKQALRGIVIDAINRVSPALIVGAFALPDSLRNELSNEAPPQTTFSLKSIQDIDTIGFAIDQPSLNLSVRIDAHFSNTASLQDAKDLITGLISTVKGSSQDPNIKTALGNIQVSSSDSWLSVRDLANPADIAALINGFKAQK